MATAPNKPERPQTVDLHKLAVSATFSSKAGSTFNILPILGGSIEGWMYVHVTDANGFELSAARQPKPEHFQLFEISSSNAFIPVQSLQQVDVLGAESGDIGALKGVLHRFSFSHMPDISGVEVGQFRQVPFILVVSPSGSGPSAPAQYAGATLLSATVLVSPVEMHTLGGSWFGG